MRTLWISQHYDRALPMLRAGMQVKDIALALEVPKHVAQVKLSRYRKRLITK